MCKRYIRIYLSEYYVTLQFNFYGKILSGKKIKEPKWETNVNIVNSHLDDAIGELFVKKYFDNKSKDYVEKMIINFKKTFSTMIDNLEWMTQKTKEKSKQKLRNITFKVGYPDKSTLKDYKNLKLSNNSFVENIIECNKYNI